MVGNDTTPKARRVQYKLYRGMSVAQKMQLVFDACRTGKLLAMASIRMQDPTLDERQLWRIWARRHLGAELFDKVYGDSTNDRAAGNPGPA
jgi:hypothetical protein